MSEHPADWLERSRAVLHRELPHLAAARDRALVRLLALLAGPLVELRGRERLEALPEPSLLVFNHNNAFECAAVPPLLLLERGGRPIHFLVDWMYLRLPVVGSVLRRLDPIPVFGKRARWGLWEGHRQAGRRAASPLALALARLAAGRTVGIFPEGTRNGRPDALLRGRRGLGPLILLSAAPVVPIGLSFPAARRLGRAPRVGRVRVEIGDPLAFAAERRALRQGLAASRDAAGRWRLLRAAGAPVVAQVMHRLGALCAKPYPFLRSTGEVEPPPLQAVAGAFPGS